MADKDTIPVWRKIYQIVSVGHAQVYPEVLEDILQICEEKLVTGLLEFKPYSKEGYESWKKLSEKMLISNDEEMCSFIHRLSKELNLDANTTWSVVCNFLIFDYYGKVDELRSIIKYEANVKSLVDYIWYFYSGDRMFMLKTLRYIFENLGDTKHIYYDEFNKFYENIDLNNLWKNLVKSFELLTVEINKERSEQVSKDTLTRWICRNNREQSEILLLMTHTLNLMKCNGTELETVIKLFLKHGFGRHPLYFGAPPSNEKDLEDICNAEISVVLTLVKQYCPGLCKNLPKSVESDLEISQLQCTNPSILFIWTIYKSTVSNDFQEHANNIIEVLIDKKVFKSFATTLKSGMFQNCKTGDILLESTNILMVEFTKLCTDYRFIYQQPGVLDILCDLLKHPNLNALDNLEPFFQASLEIFPYQLQFLDLCESLITSEKYFGKVLKLLQNVPSYCTEVNWPYNSNAVHFEEQKNFYSVMDSLHIPEGTLAERCNVFGEDVINFKIRYNYFDIIEQYIRTLTSHVVKGSVQPIVLEYLTKALEFLVFLVKHFKEDFRNDSLIRPIIHKLDCVPTFCSSNFKDFGLFNIYFKCKTSLIINQNVDFGEVFPQFIKRAVFPQINNYKDADFLLKSIHTNTDCLLYNFLKKEEFTNDHSLLIQYMELILDCLQKKQLYKEVVYTGIWFLLNVVFPLHQQWSYKNQHQQAEVLNLCIKAFNLCLVEISSEEKNDDNQAIFNLVLEAFLQNECLVASLCTIFVKDKFYLQRIMEQESNWISGPSLIYIENLRLLLVLILLVAKQKSTLPPQKYFFDYKTHIFAKAASGYFINNYSCSVSVLSCRFLGVLAKDHNTPLMSCLGLDGDQIQRLFLDQLRDPMIDEEIKTTVLDLISTCIFYQNGMTAAFFNIQHSKKWYDSKSKKLEADTVGDFLIDYLDNIKKSVDYLKSPLQVGILKVMANLWIVGKHHLVNDITLIPVFWQLLADPLFNKFEQKPLVYAYILKILSIQLSISTQKGEDKSKSKFYETLEKFLNNKKQLIAFQKFFFQIFTQDILDSEKLKDNEFFVKSFTELMVTLNKEKDIKCFPDDESKCLFVELVFDGIKVGSINIQALNTWLELTLVIIDTFKLEFEKKQQELARKVTDFARVIKNHYDSSPIKVRRLALTIILKSIKQLRKQYEKNPKDLLELLDELGPLMDFEYQILEEEAFEKLKHNEVEVREQIGVWSLLISIANSFLTLKNCDQIGIWFSNHHYLSKIMKCTCDLLQYKDTLPIGRLALYSLILYMKSPLSKHFLKMNMLQFYDKIEPITKNLLSRHHYKINPLDSKEAWIILNLLFMFTQIFLKTFQKTALDTCYSFLTLYEHIISHILTLPESTTDLKALDLLTQTLKFYNEMLNYWAVEWYRKSNRTYNHMILGVTRVINSCIYICLRPKHIGFYHFDECNKVLPVDPESQTNQDLIIATINRLLGILSLAFSCLYKLNPGLVDLLDVYAPEEEVLIFIKNDFSVPRFELPIPSELTYGKLLCLSHFLCKTLNQLHQKPKNKSYEIIEEKLFGFIGSVEHQDPSEYLPNQKLSTFLRYAMYEYSGLVDPWIDNLDYEGVKKSSEMLMTFLAQQSFLFIKIMDPRKVSYYKGNLCSELQFFNEHIRKRTSELFNATTNISFKTDTDLVKRYLITNWNQNKKDEVEEKNFLLILSYWFHNICGVH